MYKRSAFIHISIIACEPIGDDEIIVARNREIGETKTAQNGLMAINLKAGKCVNYPDIYRASTFIGTPKQVNQLENQVVQRLWNHGPKISARWSKDCGKVTQKKIKLGDNSLGREGN